MRKKENEKRRLPSFSSLPLFRSHLSRRRGLLDLHAPDERGDDGAGAEVRAGPGGVGGLFFVFLGFEVEVEFFEERAADRTLFESLKRAHSLYFAKVWAWEKRERERERERESDQTTYRWEENVAWGGEGGHERGRSK